MILTLTDNQKRLLLEEARRTAKRADAPYSRFHVGAAVLGDGKVYTGCNMESASYGLTNCAERVALEDARKNGAREITAIAVVTPDNPPNAPINMRMPCGACRQRMVDLMVEGAVVIVDGAGEFTVGELLPHPFRLASSSDTRG